MENSFTGGSRAWLTLQWRNALALLAAALFLAGLGTALLVLGGLHGGPWILLGLLLGLSSVALAGYAIHLFRLVRRGEARLRGTGVPWRVNRSLSGTAQRSLTTDALPASSLVVARDLLSEPTLGLTHIGRSWLGGVRAIRPAETGLLLMDVVPLAVEIRARRLEGRTVLTVSVVPSSVYGWPPLYGWFGWSAGYSWIEVAQSLVDYLADTLARSLSGTLD